MAEDALEILIPTGIKSLAPISPQQISHLQKVDK